MYLIELIVKKFFSKHSGYIKPQSPEEIEEERCDHIFMPIDSTGEILACQKCGAVIKKQNLKKYKKPN